MKEYRILLISSYVIGIGLGILFGLLNVLVIKNTITQTSLLIPLIELVLAASLPFCVRLVKKFGYSFLIISVVMVIVSFILCLIYAYVLRNSTMQYYPETTIFSEVMIKALIINGVFLLTSLIIHHFDMKNMEDIEDE